MFESAGPFIFDRNFPETSPLRWPQTPINRPLCCYIGLLLITTLFARNLWISVRNLEGIFTISTFYLIYLSIKDLEHLKKLLTLIFISVTFAACYGIIQHYLEVDLFRLTKPINLLKHVNDDLTAPVRISGFSSYMTFSGQLAMVIPLLCVSWCIARSYLKKRVHYGILVSCWPCSALNLHAQRMVGNGLLSPALWIHQK